MKKVVIICGVSIFILMAMSLIGCGSSSGLADMMKRMPDDATEFFVEDFKAGRAIGADELSEGYGGFLDMWRENLLDVGIDLDGTSTLAWYASDTAAFLIEGDFNLDNIRAKLEESGEHSEEYRGVEIWTKGDNIEETGDHGDLVYALINSALIIVGSEQSIDGCIGVINEGDASIYDNNDFRDIIERLPRGLTLQCSVHWYQEVEGFIIGGFSLVMNSDGTQDFTWVGKFENSEVVDSAIDIIINGLADDFIFDPAIAETTQDGEYLTITAEDQEIY